MKMQHTEQIGVGEDVPIEHDGRVINQVFGCFESAGSAARQVLMGIPHRDSILHAVAEYVDMRPGCLFLQYEGLNPSGSFKDNGMAAAFSHARMVGATSSACASTGNTSRRLLYTPIAAA
jgi:hypothetical protein